MRNHNNLYYKREKNKNKKDKKDKKHTKDQKDKNKKDKKDEKDNEENEKGGWTEYAKKWHEIEKSILASDDSSDDSSDDEININKKNKKNDNEKFVKCNIQFVKWKEIVEMMEKGDEIDVNKLKYSSKPKIAVCEDCNCNSSSSLPSYFISNLSSSSLPSTSNNKYMEHMKKYHKDLLNYTLNEQEEE